MTPIDQQTILVTGATDGLGKQVALSLARDGAALILHGRDRGRCERTLRDIRDQTGNERLSYQLADFSALDDVRALAKAVDTTYERLDVLVNNAGVGGGDQSDLRRQISRDGYELRFAVNYLAPFLLTALLRPLLERSAPARIVNVASVGQHEIDFADVMLERAYDSTRAYRQSKLAQIMFTISLAERLEGTGVTVNAVHPATLMDTKMVHEWFGHTQSTVAEGRDATLRLIRDPALDGVTGRYFDRQREGRARAQAYDRIARERLWTLSEELTGLQ